jgi:hypothetical protein
MSNITSVSGKTLNNGYGVLRSVPMRGFTWPLITSACLRSKPPSPRSTTRFQGTP